MSAVPESMLLEVIQEVQIDAAPEVAFESLITWLGPENKDPSGASLSMKLEPRVGGCWYRDLGNDDGHLWGHVQVFRKGSLLEINGPMFMSYAALSHIQFRIEASGGGSVLRLHHQAIGNIDPDHRAGVNGGWANMLEGVKNHAECK